MEFCSNCGTRLSAANKFCPGCGTAVPAVSSTSHQDDSEQQTRAVPTSSDEQETRAVPAYDSRDSHGAGHGSSAHSSYSSAPYGSRDDEATRAVNASDAYGHASSHGSASPYAQGASYASSGQGAYASSGAGYGSASHQGGAPYQSNAPQPVTLSDGRRSSGSNIGRIAAAAAAVIVLGGGAAFAYNSMKGDDSSTPSSSSSAAAGSTGGAAAPSGTADSKPKTMPDLTGKSIDEAQALLSPSVKIEASKTNLKEGMNGGALISAQETAAGQATPDTVKVTIDQPANITYINEDSSLVVDSNPFSTSEGQVANHTYKQYDTVSMSGYDTDSPEELKLNLNRAYSRLRAEVAIDSKAEDQDKVFTVTIKKDNGQIWREQIKFGDAPKPIDLDVTNALRVQIQVSVSGGTEDNRSQDSQLDFGDLRVLSEPGKGNTSSPTS